MLGLGNSLTGGAALGWEPSEIANLTMWLKVNANITADEDSSGNPISRSSNAGDMEDADKINAWNGYGGTSINAIQDITGDKPHWEADAADFGGVNSPGQNKHMDLSSDIVFDADTDFTIVVRTRPVSTTGRAIMGDSTQEFIRFEDSTTIRVKVNNLNNNDFDLASGSIADDKYITIMIVRSDGATGNINIYIRGEDSGYFDDTAAGTQFGDEIADAGEITVSNLMATSDGTAEFKGLFKDVIIYDGTAVNSTQREQLFDYIENQSY